MTHLRRRLAASIRAIAISLLLGASVQAATARPVPIGQTFQINTTPIGGQASPGVALDGNGHAVVVWQSSERVNRINSIPFVFSRRLDLRGPLAEEVGNSASCLPPVRPSVAAAASGDFMVVWEAGLLNCWDYNLDPHILARHHGDGGAGDGVRLTVDRDAAVSNPAIAVSPGGESVVVWSSAGQIAGRLYAADLTSSDKLRLASGAAGSNPTVAMDSDGDFVVVWKGVARQGGPEAIVGQRHDAHGVPRGGRFQISTDSAAVPNDAAIAMNPAGAFVVAWRNGSRRDRREIRGRLFDAAGAPVGGELLIERGSTRVSEPAVSIDGAGRFLVIWARAAASGGAGLFGRLYAVDGAPVGKAVPLALDRPGGVLRPAVAFGVDGSAVVAWQSGRDLFAQWIEVHGGEVGGGGPGDGGGDGGDGVSPDVIIPASARFGANPVIGTGTLIGEGVTVGDDAVIGEFVVLESQVRAGDRLRVGDLVFIGNRSRLGSDVVLGDGARLEGVVTLGHGVEVGDRATIKRNAWIGDGAVIGPLVVLSTGVQIGAGATIEMGASVGRRAVVKPGALVPAGTTVPPDTVFP